MRGAAGWTACFRLCEPRPLREDLVRSQTVKKGWSSGDYFRLMVAPLREGDTADRSSFEATGFRKTAQKHERRSPLAADSRCHHLLREIAIALNTLSPD